MNVHFSALENEDGSFYVDRYTDAPHRDGGRITLRSTVADELTHREAEDLVNQLEKAQAQLDSISRVFKGCRFYIEAYECLAT